MQARPLYLPDPPETTRLTAARRPRLGAASAALTPLLSALQAQAATIQAALLSLHEAEGEFGAEDGLSAPLVTLREALKALGLPDADPWI